MTDYGKKTYDLLSKSLSSVPTSNSLADKIVLLKKFLIDNASGASITTDIATIDTVVDTIQAHLESGGDIYDVLYTDAVGASLAVDIAAILTDTGELQTDWVNGGRLDLILDELTTQGDTNEGKIDTVDGVADTILIDTNEMQTDLTNGGRLDLIFDELTTQGDTNETKLDSIIAVTETGEVTGTYSYLDAGAEQTILEQTITTRREIKSIWIDTVNLTQNGTLKIYHKIDSINYREATALQKAFTVATDDGIWIEPFTVNNDWKITWTESVDENAARDILYNVIYQELE